jgi:hypothetical protein
VEHCTYLHKSCRVRTTNSEKSKIFDFYVWKCHMGM